MSSTIPSQPELPPRADDFEPPVHIEVAGQRLVLFFNTEAQCALMLNDLRTATQRIWLETYIFQDDRFGQAVAAILQEKARAGLDVRVHSDAAGSFATSSRFFDSLRTAGVQVHEFHSAWESLRGWSFFRTYNRRNHRKLLIIDDRIAFFGGMNIVDHSSEDSLEAPRLAGPGAGWRDVHVRLEGSLQSTIADSFQLSWDRAVKRTPRAAETEMPLGVQLARDRLLEVHEGQSDEEWIRFFNSGAGPRSHRAARVFVKLMRHARQKLDFSMCYFLPVGQVRRSLFRAARRKLRVRIVLPSFSDMPLIHRATRHFYHQLLKRRCRIYERRRRMLHSKVLIVDNEYVVLGSSNFDVRSLWINEEFLALIRSRRLAALLTAIINREIAHSDRIDIRLWRQQSLWNRWLGRIAWWFRGWL